MSFYDLTGSGISCMEPQPEHFEDDDDFEAAWLEWADEYPAEARRAVAGRMEC